MVEKLKTGWWKTPSLYFQDIGRVENKTRQFRVMTKNKYVLGTVQWLQLGGSYGFVPEQNRPLLYRYMTEIGEFAKQKTDRRPGKWAEIRAKKEIQKEIYRKKALTNTQINDTLDLVSEVPAPEKQVVEGVEALTPLILGETCF